MESIQALAEQRRRALDFLGRDVLEIESLDEQLLELLLE